MRRAVLTMLMLLAAVVSVMAKGEKSQTVVFIEGQRYYIHNVEKEETLYSLSALYGVDMKDITSNNSDVAQRGLQLGESIKIPFKDEKSLKRPSQRQIRKNFEVHSVRRGETLYSISRKYKISVATIVEDNPDVDPSQLALGHKLLIRKSSKGTSSHDDLDEEMEEYKDNMNKVAPEGYEYHLVEPKETLYSLLRKSQMSQRSLLRRIKLKAVNCEQEVLCC